MPLSTYKFIQINKEVSFFYISPKKLVNTLNIHEF